MITREQQGLQLLEQRTRSRIVRANQAQSTIDVPLIAWGVQATEALVRGDEDELMKWLGQMMDCATRPGRPETAREHSESVQRRFAKAMIHTYHEGV